MHATVLTPTCLYAPSTRGTGPTEGFEGCPDPAPLTPSLHQERYLRGGGEFVLISQRCQHPLHRATVKL